MKTRLLAILEIALAYLALRILGQAWRATGIPQAEIKTFGWGYTGSVLFVAVPAVIIWFTRRRWADYGVTLSNWQTNLDIGMQAYLVMFIPWIVGFGGLRLLRTDYSTLAGGMILSVTFVIAIAVMLRVLRKTDVRGKSGTPARTNLIVMGLLLLFPILVALAMHRLSVVIVSTVVWQFVCSGFGEEFVWRGYVQSRLNQAFGRPWTLCGVQCGPGLIIASLLFGLFHAFNTYDPASGQYELAWGWALWTTFSGLFFGAIREKTGSLLACGIAHGLPDAVGEALGRVLGWM